MSKNISALVTDMGAFEALKPVLEQIPYDTLLHVDMREGAKAKDAVAMWNPKNDHIRIVHLKENAYFDLGDLTLTGTTPKQGEHFGHEADVWNMSRLQGVPSIAHMDSYKPSEVTGRLLGVSGELYYPDVLLVGTKSAVDALRSYVPESTKIEFVGNPKYDSVVRQDPSTLYRPDRQRIVPIFLSSQNYMSGVKSTNENLLATIGEALGGVPDLSFVVKTHPKDGPDLLASYAGALGKYTSNFIIDAGKPARYDSNALATALDTNEFALGDNSSLLVTAAYANNLSVSLQTTDDVTLRAMEYATLYPHLFNATELQAFVTKPGRFDIWKKNRADYVTSKATPKVLEAIDSYLR